MSLRREQRSRNHALRSTLKVQSHPLGLRHGANCQHVLVVAVERDHPDPGVLLTVL